MKVRSEKFADVTENVESLRRELDASRTRVGEMERAEALLAGENRLLELVAKGEPLPTILNGICRLVEENASGCLCSILLLDPNADRLRHGAAPSLPKKYTEAIDGALIGPRAGSCGTAAYRNEPVIVSNIETDPLWTDYRHLALAAGLRACWSTPIFSTAREVLGTFALYRREPASPVPEQQGIVGQFAHLASIAIERARSQDALRRGEAYLTEAQRLSLTGSFGWRVASGELIWSAETFCIMGYDRSVKPSLELAFQRIHPDDIAVVKQILDRATRDETTLDFEHRLLMPDGAIKHVHVVARAAKDPSGGVEFVGAVMDITERKKSQDALRAAKARFEGILEIADDAIISVDSNQQIVLFNQGAEKVFGYVQAEVIGKPLDLLLPQRFAHAHHGHIESFAKSTDVSRTMGQRREVFGRRKDGTEFPAEASISKLNLSGEYVFTVILRDITERKQAAEAIRASERFARGQTEALTHALDALAMESSPDRLVEHILRTLTEQFGAHSSSVWRRDEAKGMIGFEFAFEDGMIAKKTDSRFAGMDLWLPMEDFWPWPEVFRTGKPSVIEDIRTVPPFALRDRLLPLGIVTVLLIPMSVVGRLEGSIGLRFTHKRGFRAEEIELAQALANQAMLAMQLTRLSAESRESAVLAERNRMARDMHDTLAQGFTGIIMQLEAAKGAIAGGGGSSVSAHIERAAALARASLGEARRSVRAMRSRSLVDGTLSTALDELLKRMTSGTELQAELTVQGEGRPIPPDWEEGLLRIAQESLTNTIKYAQARRFRAALNFAAGSVRLQLVDDGRGFDAQAEHDGFGLVGMRERAEQMAGNFVLRSTPGQGTEIVVELKQSNGANGNHEDRQT